MKASIQLSGWQRAEKLALSMPAQVTLYTALCALTLWTVYFTTYPAAHNAAHSLRHHTAGISCH
jgi:Probable cobalt transporter subunit (CbtB)